MNFIATNPIHQAMISQSCGVMLVNALKLIETFGFLPNHSLLPVRDSLNVRMPSVNSARGAAMAIAHNASKLRRYRSFICDDHRLLTETRNESNHNKHGCEA